MVQGITCYQDERLLEVPVLTTALVTVLVGILLCIGLLTRFATAIAALGTLGSIFSWLPAPKSGLFQTHSTEVLALVIAAAVAAVGPGSVLFRRATFRAKRGHLPEEP